MKKLKRVTLLIETSRAFGRELLTGIARYSKIHGPWSFYREPRGLKSALPHLEKWEADGIIMRNTPVSKKMLDFNVPVITVLHYQKNDSGFPTVQTDSEAISELAAKHLMNRGFRNFAFCGFKDLDWSLERENHFKNYLKNFGHNSFLYSPLKNISVQKELNRIADWLQELPKPVGIMACNDDRGQHILEACKLAELHVPEEIAVIGVDNDTLICDLCDPPLSSIALNTIEAGYKTAELMDNLMNGEKMGGQLILVSPTHVVKRQSTDILAINDENLVKALSFINSNAKERISVNDVVNVTALSRRSLENKFKAILGRSVMEEVRRIRIDQISKMLIETELSISEIASAFNFTEIEHISRYFRKEKMMSMRDFRKRLKRC
jgi:LacI family transcriptional regulator